MIAECANSNIVAFHAHAIGTDIVFYPSGGEIVAFGTVTLNEGQLYGKASNVGRNPMQSIEFDENLIVVL